MNIWIIIFIAKEGQALDIGHILVQDQLGTKQAKTCCKFAVKTNQLPQIKAECVQSKHFSCAVDLIVL